MADYKLPELMNYIDGKKFPPTESRNNYVKNSNTGEELQMQMACTVENLEVALKATEKAYKDQEWELLGEKRAEHLNKIADLLDDKVDYIAWMDAITTGVSINFTSKTAQFVPHAFRAAATFLKSGVLCKKVPGPAGDVEILTRPWGPTALINPWNGPSAIGSHKLALALAAGCPVILKASEWAPHSCVVMAEACHQAGLPHGVFQLICGNRTVGSKLIADPRIKSVSFTGGLVGGRAISHACAEDFKPCQLELGGNNSFVVFEDADLELAAQGVVTAITTLNAQWCRAIGRLIVHENVKDSLIAKVMDKLSQIKLGSSLDPANQMGPMIHEGHLKSIQNDVAALVAKGGQIHQSTPMPNLAGWFMPPTLITGLKSTDTHDEIFGPVAMVHTFADDKEALFLANETPFGLAGYVFSQNVDKAWAFSREMTTGGVKINGVTLTSLNPGAPRPAWGLSGIGEEGQAETFNFFCGRRVVGRVV